MCFFLKFFWFFWTLPVLLQRWFSTCLVRVHTLIPRENRERLESEMYFKIFQKTQYLMNTLYVRTMSVPCPPNISRWGKGIYVIVRCFADIVRTYIWHVSDICPGIYVRHISFFGFQLWYLNRIEYSDKQSKHNSRIFLDCTSYCCLLTSYKEKRKAHSSEYDWCLFVQMINAFKV